MIINLIEIETSKLSNMNLEHCSPETVVLGDLDLLGWVILKNYE